MNAAPAKTDGNFQEAVAILGVPFDCVRAGEAVERIEQMIASGKPHFVVTANVDFLVQARADIELRRILIASDLVLCDGTPVLWASRFLGNRLPERVAGSDIVPTLLQLAEQKSYRVFILGGSPQSAAQAGEKVRRKLPNIQLECYSPPFNRLLEMDHEEIRKRIKAARPDLLLVSFGCPKQEKWIYMHYRDLGVPVSIGVGGTVDFLAEHLKRAPMWMRKSGTEWVYRLLQEPRRLAGRYTKDLWVFGNAFLRQVALHRMPFSQTSESAGRGFMLEQGYRCIKLPAAFNRASLRGNQLLSQPRSEGQGWILDGSEVSHIDSTAIACLTRWNAQRRSRGSSVLLAGATPRLRRALQFAGAWDFFETAPDAEAARYWMLQKQEDEGVSVRHQTSPFGFTLIWHGEITAASAPSVWRATSAILEERSPAEGTKVTLQLAEVPFMDSTGLGTVIRLRKALLAKGAELTLLNVQPAVRNVIRISQLESLLIGKSPKAEVKNETTGMPPIGTHPQVSEA